MSRFLKSFYEPEGIGRLCTLLLAVALLCWFYRIASFAPPFSDDFGYSRLIMPGADGEIRTFMQYPASLKEAWESGCNARYITDARMQNILFCILHYLGGFPLLTAVNAASFVAFLCLAAKMLCGRVSFCSLSAIALSAGILISVWPRTSMWHVAALAYTCGLTLCVLFLYVFQGLVENGWSPVRFLLCVLLAVLCSWLTEALGVPLCVGLASYACVSYLRRKKLPYVTIGFLCAIMAGFSVWLLEAPGFRHRINAVCDGNWLLGYGASCAFFFIYCWPVITIAGICLLRHWRKSFDSLYLFMAAPAVGVALFSKTFWGASYVFACLLLMLYIWEQERDFLCNFIKTRCGCLLISIFLLAGILYQDHYFSRLNELYMGIINRAKEEHIVAYDFIEKDSDYNWWMSCSLPGHCGDNISCFLSDMYSVPPFVAVLNLVVRDKSVLETFGEPGDEPVWKKCGEVSIIQLPQGQGLLQSDKHKGYKGSVAYSLVKRIKSGDTTPLLKLLGKKLIYSSDLYYKDHYYFAMEAEGNELDTVELTIEDLNTRERRSVTVHPE